MAARRTARLRQEYLYRKSLEGKEKEAYERKERLKAALAGKVLASPCARPHNNHTPPFPWQPASPSPGI